MQPVRNIIFDLGGIIINLDTPATIKAFEALGAHNFQKVYTQQQQVNLFDDLDKGMISDSDFRRALNQLMGLALTDAEFDHAWNAMLLDFPKLRLDLLKTLRPRYRTFLLSNTNHIHVRAFEAILLKAHGQPNLQPFFEKTYYSCNMGLRKPDRIIFERVLKENNLNPQETIFIDDSPQHVAGGEKAGIRAFLLNKGEEVGDLLKQLKLL